MEQRGILELGEPLGVVVGEPRVAEVEVQFLQSGRATNVDRGGILAPAGVDWKTAPYSTTRNSGGNKLKRLQSFTDEKLRIKHIFRVWGGVIFKLLFWGKSRTEGTNISEWRQPPKTRDFISLMSTTNCL